MNATATAHTSSLPYMTLGRMIALLTDLAAEVGGDAPLILEEECLGYAATLTPHVEDSDSTGTWSVYLTTNTHHDDEESLSTYLLDATDEALALDAAVGNVEVDE